MRKLNYLNSVRLLSGIFTLFIVTSVFCIACSSNNKAETNEQGCENMANKPLPLHEIKNETLKDYIVQYDNEHNEGEKGIAVWCEICNDTTKYRIAYYDPSTHSSAPMIKCEPINGREIIIIFWNFENDIELAADKVLELNKEAISEKDYEKFEKIVANNAQSKIQEHIIPINDKISITLNFGKDNNLIRIDTCGFK
ncbi:hypothetical protein M2138_002051 [Dysgonomonadaceae bacterium PH5-43]|nr:hypothetical protein [Dysgonomonadaceae bacterium PH5-43]